MATDSGASDSITNAGTVNVSGLESRASWQYNLDGATWNNGTGTSFAVSGDGAKSVTVRQTDLAGNTGAASTTFALTLDTTAPAARALTLP